MTSFVTSIMIQGMNRTRLALVLVGLVSSSAAFAGSSFSIVGAGVLPQSQDLGTDPASGGAIRQVGKLGYGAGALAELRMTHHLGLEVGGIYLLRKYGSTIGGTDSGTTDLSRSVYIPVGLRIHPNPTITLQGGGFYDVSVESGGGSNYGIQGGLRLAFRAGNSSSFFVEGRYNLGLKDHGGGFKASDLVLAMVGLTFGAGGGR